MIVKPREVEHNHGPSSALLAVQRAESDAIQNALANHHNSTARTVTSSVSAALTTPEMVALGSSSKALEMRLQRGMNMLKKHPKVPKTYEGLVTTLPQSLTLDHTGRPLLR
jgi:hypothetical protein